MAGAHVFCFRLFLRSVPRVAAITPKKSRRQHPSVPLFDYAATKRADDPKITLGAPALRHDVIPSSQGVGFIAHALFSRLLFMSRET